MSYRRLGLVGALLSGLLAAGGIAGTATAATATQTPDITFSAFGTGNTVAAAQSAAAASVATEESNFSKAVDATCGGALSTTQNQYQLSAGGVGASLVVGVYCGTPGPTGNGVPFFYGFATSGTQTGQDGSALAAATANETSYEQATGATCSQSLAPISMQSWQLTQGTASLVTVPSDGCAAASSSPSPTGSPAPSPTPTPSGSCQVSYAASNWQGGFTANVTITNTGTSPVNGWTLAFTFPGDQRITSGWNTTVTQTGARVAAANVSYDATIAPGASQTLGFQGTWTASDTAPTTFRVNGTPCS